MEVSYCKRSPQTIICKNHRHLNGMEFGSSVADSFETLQCNQTCMSKVEITISKKFKYLQYIFVVVHSLPQNISAEINIAFFPVKCC